VTAVTIDAKIVDTIGCGDQPHGVIQYMQLLQRLDKFEPIRLTILIVRINHGRHAYA